MKYPMPRLVLSCETPIFLYAEKFDILFFLTSIYEKGKLDFTVYLTVYRNNMVWKINPADPAVGYIMQRPQPNASEWEPGNNEYLY